MLVEVDVMGITVEVNVTYEGYTVSKDRYAHEYIPPEWSMTNNNLAVVIRILQYNDTFMKEVHEKVCEWLD